MENIKKISKIFPTQKYVDIIIACCEKILPQFDNALQELNPIIENLENIYSQGCEELKKP